MYKRGWDKNELIGLTGLNLLRVLEGAERVSREMKADGVGPAMALYDKREDLPMPRWDGL
jgi:membrane dipeptidase